MTRSHVLLGTTLVAVALSAAAWVARGALTRGGAHASYTAKSEKSEKSERTWLTVPHVRGNITLDGDMDDSGWLNGCARTEAFVADDGSPARPYSDIRLLWDGNFLYLALYAGDQEIRAEHAGLDAPVWLDDSFHFMFETEAKEYSFDVSATGVVADGVRDKGARGPFDFGWNSGAHTSYEVDGTINQPGDYDEEWVIEMAIPLESLGLQGVTGERIGFSARRCDTFATGERSCGTWGRQAPHGGLVLGTADAVATLDARR